MRCTPAAVRTPARGDWRCSARSPSPRPSCARPTPRPFTTPDIQSSTVVGPNGTIYATTFAGWTYARARQPERAQTAWSSPGASDRPKAARRRTARRRSRPTATWCTWAMASAPRRTRRASCTRCGRRAAARTRRSPGRPISAPAPSPTARRSPPTARSTTSTSWACSRRSTRTAARVKWTAQIGTSDAAPVRPDGQSRARGRARRNGVRRGDHRQPVRGVAAVRQRHPGQREVVVRLWPAPGADAAGVDAGDQRRQPRPGRDRQRGFGDDRPGRHDLYRRQQQQLLRGRARRPA